MSEPMIKVYARIRDGEHVIEEYAEGHEKAGLAFSEMTAAEFREYRDHMEKDREWYDFVRDLSNEQYQKEQKAKEDQRRQAAGITGWLEETAR